MNISSRRRGGCQENSGDPNAFPRNPQRPVPTERFPSLRPPRKPLHTRTPYLEPPETRINIAPGDARNVHVCRHAFSTRRDLAAGCRCDFLNFGVWVKEIKLFDLRFGFLVKSWVYGQDLVKNNQNPIELTKKQNMFFNLNLGL